MDCLNSIQNQLIIKLQGMQADVLVSPREKEVLRFTESHLGTGSDRIAEALKVSLRTVQQTLTELLKKELIIKQGIGKATTYSIL